MPEKTLGQATDTLKGLLTEDWQPYSAFKDAAFTAEPRYAQAVLAGFMRDRGQMERLLQANPDGSFTLMVKKGGA